MEQIARDETVRRVAATLGVVGTLALAYYYVLAALLTVPTPASWVFHGAWLVMVVLSIAWWRRHPWRSLAVPIVGLVVGVAALWFGGEYLGWAP